ncbi:MAG TPA: amino acid permease [Fluviicola sp.]|nr:amino acid permease [Fluviicola sp.]
MAELKRTLNLAEVIFFASGVILGAGIYTVIGKAAGVGGNTLWISFLIAAFTALFSLFAYAELVSVFPSAGGEYSYVRESINLKWAYVVGTLVALSSIVSTATISIGFAGYLSQLTDFPQHIAALLIIALIWGINVLGIRQSSIVNIVFTLLETAGLLFVIWAAAPALGEVRYTELPENGVNGLIAGAALCFFAFTGFEDVVKLAEETKKPEKTIPKALFISANVVMVIYVCIAILVVSMIPFAELAESDSPLATVVEKRFGHNGALIIAVVALFSTSNSLLSNMLGASRVLYSIGKEKNKLRFLGTVLPNRKTPVYALIAAALVAAGFSLIGEVEKVALITNFFVFITFIIINLTVIYLRVKQPDLKRPFKIPGNIRNIPVISIVAVLMLLLMIGYAVYGLVGNQ